MIDVTATPRHDNGASFVQTVTDYPPVEAIHQNVVKHPVLPDAASRDRLKENASAIFSERYDDYLRLGIEEWKKSYAEHQTLGKKAVLFVMVDDTKSARAGGRMQSEPLKRCAERLVVGECAQPGRSKTARPLRPGRERLARDRRGARLLSGSPSPLKSRSSYEREGCYARPRHGRGAFA